MAGPFLPASATMRQPVFIKHWVLRSKPTPRPNLQLGKMANVIQNSGNCHHMLNAKENELALKFVSTPDIKGTNTVLGLQPTTTILANVNHLFI